MPNGHTASSACQLEPRAASRAMPIRYPPSSDDQRTSFNCTDEPRATDKPESVDKPGSVADNHSSGTTVAESPLAAYPNPARTTPSDSYLALLRAGMPSRNRCLIPRCALTAPFHPYRPRRLNSRPTSEQAVCFLLHYRRLTPPRGYLAPCPVEPGLSSRRPRGHARLPDRLTPRSVTPSGASGYPTVATFAPWVIGIAPTAISATHVPASTGARSRHGQFVEFRARTPGNPRCQPRSLSGRQFRSQYIDHLGRVGGCCIAVGPSSRWCQNASELTAMENDPGRQYLVDRTEG